MQSPTIAPMAGIWMFCNILSTNAEHYACEIREQLPERYKYYAQFYLLTLSNSTTVKKKREEMNHFVLII